MQTEIKRWGNSAAVRLSSKILAAASLGVNSPITINVKGKKIVIEPVVEQADKRLKLPFSEAMLLADLTPETVHADELAAVTSVELGD
ncbi:MazF family transcriptional regulator [Pseudomonadota bacterium]